MKKKWLAFALAAIMMLGIVGGVAAANGPPHKAAPAVANELLRENGIRGGIGPWISRVARQMGPEAEFEEVSKWNVEAYREAVRDFLEDIMADREVSKKPDETIDVFSPKDIDGLFLWLDASTLDLEDGEPVRTWFDLSDNDFDMVQAASDRYPVYQSGALNQKPVVYFDAEFKVRLESPIFDSTEYPLTVFVVGSKEGGDDRGYILSSRGEEETDESSGAIALARFGRHLSAYAGSWLRSRTSDTFDYQLVTVLFNSINSEIFINGVHKATGNTGDRNMTQFFIGGRGDDQDYFTGDIAEVIIFEKALTTSQQQQVEGYLLEKYDL